MHILGSSLVSDVVYIHADRPLGVRNGMTRAIDVPAGFLVELFSKSDFSGTEVVYKKGTHDLSADFKLGSMRVARYDASESGAFASRSAFLAYRVHLRFWPYARK